MVEHSSCCKRSLAASGQSVLCIQVFDAISVKRLCRIDTNARQASPCDVLFDPSAKPVLHPLPVTRLEVIPHNIESVTQRKHCQKSELYLAFEVLPRPIRPNLQCLQSTWEISLHHCHKRLYCRCVVMFIVTDEYMNVCRNVCGKLVVRLFRNSVCVCPTAYEHSNEQGCLFLLEEIHLQLEPFEKSEILREVHDQHGFTFLQIFHLLMKRSRLLLSHIVVNRKETPRIVQFLNVFRILACSRDGLVFSLFAASLVHQASVDSSVTLPTDGLLLIFAFATRKDVSSVPAAMIALPQCTRSSRSASTFTYVTITMTVEQLSHIAATFNMVAWSAGSRTISAFASC